MTTTPTPPIDNLAAESGPRSEMSERETLAEVIGQHAYDTGWRCSCGWTGSADEYDLHLADALADLLAARDRRVRAEAITSLREVADQADSIGHRWSGGFAHDWFTFATDLRDRADRIEAP